MGSESPPSGGNDAYCIAGREVPQDKSKAMQEILLVTQWVSVFSLEGQIVILCKSQRTVKHVVTMPLTEYQELAPKFTYCILNLLLPFLTIGKKSLWLFMKLIVLLCLLVCISWCTCRVGLWSLAVSTSAWLHMCCRSHGCWSVLCCVVHITMTEK